jgi:hypothetical protein
MLFVATKWDYFRIKPDKYAEKFDFQQAYILVYGLLLFVH